MTGPMAFVRDRPLVRTYTLPDGGLKYFGKKMTPPRVTLCVPCKINLPDAAPKLGPPCFAFTYGRCDVCEPIPAMSERKTHAP